LGQGVQWVAPAEEQKPRAHGVQLELPGAAEKEPDAHAAQRVLPTPAAAKPAVHGVHLCHVPQATWVRRTT
jgi:hypothetical protein